MLSMRLIINFFLNYTEKASIIDFAFIGLHSFCNQSGCHDLKNIHLRIVIITLRIVALLIIPAYGAVITSYLAVQIPRIPFSNLDEFIEDKGYVLAMYRSRFLKYYYGVFIDVF